MKDADAVPTRPPPRVCPCLTRKRISIQCSSVAHISSFRQRGESARAIEYVDVLHSLGGASSGLIWVMAVSLRLAGVILDGLKTMEASFGPDIWSNEIGEVTWNIYFLEMFFRLTSRLFENHDRVTLSVCAFLQIESICATSSESYRKITVWKSVIFWQASRQWLAFLCHGALEFSRSFKREKTFVSESRKEFLES